MLDYILHLDKHLEDFIKVYGPWIYPLVTGIIFLESAFVIFPFLPGDSLIFTVGFLSTFSGMNIWLVGAMMILAAIVGNDINYRIGKKFGPKLFSKPNHKFFNRDNLEKTNSFFERYGNRAVVIARFVPFVRSFVPFVAGMANMDYARFTRFNVIGGISWIVSFLAAGYLLGRIPVVRENLEYAVPIIVILTLLPMWFEYRRHKKESAEKKAAATVAVAEEA